MIKSITIAALLILSTFQVFSQARSFDGGWIGEMEKDDGDTYSITLYIEDNNVYTLRPVSYTHLTLPTKA